MKSGNLDELLAQARHVPESSLPPGFAVTVMDRTEGARRWSRKVLIAWTLAALVLAGCVALSLFSGPEASLSDTAPPLPLFRAQDFPFDAP